MRLSGLFCCSTLLLSLSAHAQVQPADDAQLGNRFLQPADVFNIEYASDVQISPDGDTVAYARRSNDIMTDKTRSNIWLVDADGDDHRPLLSGRADYTLPRWSPDGERIAYISSVEGSPQLYVKWMSSGDSALITNLTEAPSDLAWSPDGRLIAFVMNDKKDKKPFAKIPKKPEGADWAEPFNYIEEMRYRFDGEGYLDPAYAHIFVVPADGGSAKRLTNGDFNHQGPLSWTPDSKSIVFSANRNPEWELQTVEADIYSVSLEGALNRITSKPGAESEPAVSPSGNQIAYVGADNNGLAFRTARLFVMDSDGGEVRSLTPNLDRSVESPVWDAAGRGVYYLYDDRGERKVGYARLNGQNQTVAENLGGATLGRPYVSGDFSVSGNGVIAYTKGAPDRPADVALKARGNVRQLTTLNEDALGDTDLGAVHEIIYESSLDGVEIQGWYVTPPDFDPAKKYPLILEIHGGPHAAYGPNFSLEVQRYAAEGYVVFYDNHRGSSSYGEEFGLLLQHKYPSRDDFADHMSGVDAMIAKGFIAENELYVTGGSAGGVSTAYLVGLTDRFRAAVAAKPIINWTSKVLTGDIYVYQITHQFPGAPWEEFEHYWERSPLSLVGNVSTPTMLLTGEEDYRTPISESEQFYQALKLRGVDTALVRVPGSSHGIAGRPSRLIGKVEHILGWFERYSPQNASSAEE
ncbi:prolyl oligopeptidase family serine peptidase [Hyphococcus sp.]|uniref:prolyl oligopeptidase family serine peptidase n=1 Tax=Hyphococcus sp. TaxID=2038636 RepID=UPI003CCC0F7B